MTQALPHRDKPCREAPPKNGGGEPFRYGFDETRGSHFYKMGGKKVYCAPEDLLRVSEPYQMDPPDRGAILMGLPL